MGQDLSSSEDVKQGERLVRLHRRLLYIPLLTIIPIVVACFLVLKLSVSYIAFLTFVTVISFFVPIFTFASMHAYMQARDLMMKDN